MNPTASKIDPETEWASRNTARSKTPDVVPGVPADLTHSVDQYGSLVTVPPAEWLICFVPGLQKQWWHRFVNARHKHVFAMRPTDTASWILVEPWWTRLMVTLLPSADAVKFLRWGASGDILRVREAVPGHGNQARGWSNCAVLSSFVLGRASHTWTPHGLYRQLCREKDVKHENVEDLIVEQIKRMVGKASANALRLDPELIAAPLETVLTHLGRDLVFAFMDPSILQLGRMAVIEAERFPRAARAYCEHGIEPAVATLTRILQDASDRGDIKVRSCPQAASQFIAMLRGNMQLEAVLELREPPSAAEVDARVEAVVNGFLRGVAKSGRNSSQPATFRDDRRRLPGAMKVLAISGSLRAASINSSLLRAAARLAPPQVQVRVFRAVGELPLFNPDLEATMPPPVAAFHAEVAACDALLIASPEYAHGVTGTIKNALDWLVSFEPFIAKPVAVLNASPRARHADEALRETLKTMSAVIVEEASIGIPLLGARLVEDGMVEHPAIARAIRGALLALHDAVVLRRSAQGPTFPLP